MVGPAVLTFVKEMGEFFGRRRPEIFGFIDSLEGVDLANPGLESLVGSHFWEGMPRYAFDSEADAFYRERLGVNDEGASADDPRDVSTYGHMFSVWETLMVIRRGMQAADYTDKGDRRALIEAVEGFETFEEGRGAPAGREDVQRAHPPGVRAAVHHAAERGRERRAAARRRAHDVDRGRALRGRGRLHDAIVLVRRRVGRTPPWTWDPTSCSRRSRAC